MSDIDHIDLRLVDMTILMVFLGCMQHRKATIVAREMSLTQPAVSHALKRLRALYGDPLFLRRSHGLEPTALAQELEPKVRRIVRLMSETLSDQAEFRPQEIQANVKIAAFDYELSTVLPDLVATLCQDAPGISVHVLPLSNRDALAALVDGRVDLAIGCFEFPTTKPDVFLAETLFHERYVVAGRSGHQIFRSDMTLGDFAEAEHILISPFGPVKTMVDHALLLQNLRRSVRVTVPSLFAALSIVESSDLVVSLPKRVAERNAERFNLRYEPLPIEGGQFKLHVVRHVRDANSALQVWLFDRLKVMIA